MEVDKRLASLALEMLETRTGITPQLRRYLNSNRTQASVTIDRLIESQIQQPLDHKFRMLMEMVGVAWVEMLRYLPTAQPDDIVFAGKGPSIFDVGVEI